MRYKVITLKDNTRILVDESTGEINNYVTDGVKIAKVNCLTVDDPNKHLHKKLIATINHSISLDVPMVVVEDEVMKLAIIDASLIWNDETTLENEQRELNGHIVGFINGHKANQQKGVYSEADLRSMFNFGVNEGAECQKGLGRCTYEQYLAQIQSANKDHIELEMDWDCPLKECVKQNPNCVLPNSGVCKAQEIIKTTRDSSGQLIAYAK